MLPKQYVISDLKKLTFLFAAGGGEFFFYNSLTKVQFNLKFTPVLYHPGWSLMEVCFTKPGNTHLYYNEIGQYNFKDRQMKFKSNQMLIPESLKLIHKTLAWVLTNIHTGKPFRPDIMISRSARCCRCSKQLTNLDSIHKGFGPECEEQYKLTKPVIQLNLL